MNVLATLQKLIDLEKSAAAVGNTHEAAAAAGRIQYLLSKHRLTMSDVEYAQQKAEDPIKWEPLTLGERRKKKMDQWRHFLCTGIAESNGCKFVCAQDSDLFYFVGRSANREVCKRLLTYLTDMGFSMCEDAWKKENDATNAMLIKRYGRTMFNGFLKEVEKVLVKKRRHFRESFFFGYGGTVAVRLLAAYKEAQADANSETAIVHVNAEDKAVEDEVLKHATKAEQIKPKAPRSEAGLLAGSDAANMISLSPNQIGG